MRRAVAFSVVGAIASCVQQQAKVARIAYLAGFHDPATDPAIEAFHDGLRELGYVDGKTLDFDLRFGEGDAGRYASYVADFVRKPVDVMATSNDDALRAMRAATSTIPIVMTFSADPVEAGRVQSLSRPGGNITGIGAQGAATTVKRLELLKEASPSVLLVAVLSDGLNTRAASLRALDEAAPRIGVQLVVFEVPAASASTALVRAFETATARGANALLVLNSQIHIVMLRKDIVAYALTRKIPSSFPSFGGYVEDGGLMAYGEDFEAAFRRAASFVDRILKGASPAELPVEQPPKFDLVINLRTARALAITVPQSVLGRATQVIE